MCICALIVTVILFPIWMIGAGFSGAAAMESATSNPENYRKYDFYVEQRLKENGQTDFLPVETETLDVLTYSYAYQDILREQFKILAEISWENEKDFDAELLRLENCGRRKTRGT